jgi:hypothetical protein
LLSFLDLAWDGRVVLLHDNYDRLSDQYEMKNSGFARLAARPIISGSSFAKQEIYHSGSAYAPLRPGRRRVNSL